jgi:proteic killer suppression protein
MDHMIKSFAHKGLKELFTEGKTKRIGADFLERCEMILNALDYAQTPQDMNLPMFAFHGLQGNPKRYSVKMNKNWRMTFGWDNGATDVDLEDYH